ncbi:MAG: DUF4129 domain-containing protein [Prevotella sp.]|nr:DUF4129 domain-containing protein [Prevotella sp.]
MPVNTSSIMQNDSLAARLFQGHDYNRSLVGDSLVRESNEWEDMVLPDNGHTSSNIHFFDSIADFLSGMPTFVYIVIGVVLAACIAYWMARNGLLYRNPELDGDDVEEGTDDIYAVDIDSELADARQHLDHAAMVRLVYLRTLRTLDESRRIDWRIYKTPSQYAQEYAHPSFVRMTHHFLRVRYGKFPATQELCDEMESLSLKVQKGGEA